MEDRSKTAANITIEIGRAYLRAGFGGEAEPRVEIAIGTSFGSRKSCLIPTVGADVICCWYDRFTEPEWREALCPLLETVYRRLLVRAQNFPAALIISPSLAAVCTDKNGSLCKAIEKVLLEYLQVPQIMYVDSNRAISSALSRISGSSSLIVIDIGRYEGRCVCIYNGTALLETWHTCPVGFDALVETILLKWIHLKQDKDFSTLSSCTDSDYRYAKFLIGAFHFGDNNDSSNWTPTTSCRLYHQISSFHGIPSKTLHGIVYSTVCDFYFSLTNQHGLIPAFMDSALSCPIDLRRVMLQNVAFVGGSSYIPKMEYNFFTTVMQLFSSQEVLVEVPPIVDDILRSKYYSLQPILQYSFSSADKESTKSTVDINRLSVLSTLPFSSTHATWIGGGMLPFHTN